jgi:hypothetical protein
MSSIGGRSGSFVVPGGLVELGYGQLTSNLDINNATAGTGVEVIAPVTVVCDGSPILVEFFAPEIRPSNTVNDEINISLFEDSSEKIRSWGRNYNAAGGYNNKPAYLSVKLTPSAGSHTYGVKAFVNDAGRVGSVGGGTGTSTTSAPAFLRVSKIIEQGTVLKPFWTPPIVQELPSNPTVGDIVIYAANITNGVYWQLQYDGLGTYPWKFVGGGPLTASSTSGLSGTITSTAFVAGTPDLAVALPLSGDYWTTTTALATNNTAGAWWMVGLDGPGTAMVDQLCARVMQHSPGNEYTNGAHSIKRTFTSSGTVQMQYRVTTGIATFAERGFSLTPIRVAA